MQQVEQSTRSTNRSFKRLIKVNGTKPEEIYKAICSQTVELIFTAHPTQVNRGHIWLHSAPPWLDEHAPCVMV